MHAERDKIIEEVNKQIQAAANPFMLGSEPPLTFIPQGDTLSEVFERVFNIYESNRNH